MTETQHETAAASGTDLILTSGFRMAIHDATGARVSPETLIPGEAGDRSAISAWENWKDALKGQLAHAGLLFRVVKLDFEAARCLARPGTPLVTWSKTSGWIALLESDRKRVRIARPKYSATWIRETEWVALLDTPWLETSREWVALEAGFTTVRGDRVDRSKRGSLSRLLEIVHPERTDIFAIILYSAFAGLLSLAIPIAVQQLVNTVAFGGLVQPVVVLALLMLSGLAIAACLRAIQAFLAELLQRRIFVRGCLDLAHRLPRVSEEAFGHRSAPAFVNRFFDLVTVQKAGARILVEGSGVVLQTAAGLLILSFYHPLMLALSIFLLGSMGMVAYGFGRGAPASALGESSAKYDIAAWMEELVRHPTAFRSSAGRRRAEVRADALVVSWVDARRRHYRMVFRQFFAALCLQVVVNTGLLALGGFLVVAGELTLGQLVASEIIVASVVASFSQLAKHFESYYDLLAAADKVSSLFDLPLESAHREEGWPFGTTPGNLACHNVGLEIGGRRVLQDISLRVAPRERVALVGQSGAGKSVLVDILSGIRTPSAGYVTLNGRDLRDQSRQTTRDHVGLIRSPQTLPMTILENLTMGTLETSLDDVQEVLARVGLLGDVRKLAEGLETRLDDRGTPLSRNQAVRLEVAKILLAKPAIILVDCDTVDSDDPAMAATLDAIFGAEGPWTVLAVARSAATISRCSRVIEIDAGFVTDRSQTSSDGVRPGDTE